jgi:hypothetical protein
MNISLGEVVLIPASIGSIEFRIETPIKLLESSIP